MLKTSTILRAAMLSVLVSLGALVAPAHAQTAVSAELTNPNVTIDYVDPRNPVYDPIVERLKRQQFLERLQQFLSPLNLPRPSGRRSAHRSPPRAPRWNRTALG